MKCTYNNSYSVLGHQPLITGVSQQIHFFVLWLIRKYRKGLLLDGFKAHFQSRVQKKTAMGSTLIQHSVIIFSTLPCYCIKRFPWLWSSLLMNTFDFHNNSNIWVSQRPFSSPNQVYLKQRLHVCQRRINWRPKYNPKESVNWVLQQTSMLFHKTSSAQTVQGMVLFGQSSSKCFFRSFLWNSIPQFLGQDTATKSHSFKWS